MRLRNWGGFWAVVVFAILPLAAVAQQSNDMLLQQQQLRSGVPGQPISGQLPRITNAPSFPLTPEQSRQLQQLAPAAPPAPAVQAAVPLRLEEKLEFEEFISKSLGKDLPLYGQNLFLEAPSTFAPLDQIAVPADYVIGPGDEIYVRAWGQIEIDYRAIVDRDGRIHIPRVGSVTVSGVPYQDLDGLIRRAVGRVFKNFELNVTLGQLRSIQIFVVGQARRPGSYVVSSLSTLVNALFASSGPTHKGTMRRIQLKRGNKVVTEFDLYDLLLKGDKSRDAKLLPGDVLFIPPIGQLAAVSGSVNVPAIYEIKDQTKLGDLIAMAGGLSATAAGQKVTLERIAARLTRQVEEFPLDAGGMARQVRDGDLVNVYALSPRIENAVTLRGNVAEPMRFAWRSGLRIKDIIPEIDALVVHDYWIRKNEAGRTSSWISDGAQFQPSGTLPQPGGIPRQPGSTPRPPGSALPQTSGGLPQPIDISGVLTPRNDIVHSGLEINWDYAVVERLNLNDLTTNLIPFNLARAVVAGDPEHNHALQPGDIITVFSKDDLRVPRSKQTKYVRLEGEFTAAGVYQASEGETLRDLVTRVGGLTPNAYLYGSEFTRESTRLDQQKRLEDTLDRLEQEAQRAAAERSGRVVDPRDVEALKTEADAQQRLIARLRQIKATGRIVLELPPEGASTRNIPDLALEDGDRFYVPPQPSTVSVFGSVYNQNAYIYRTGKRVGDYITQAGGPTRNADKASIYLVKADGSVVSKRQRGTFFNSFNGQRVMPGDAIVVPEDLEKFRWTRELKDWSQIFYQFALGVAGLKVLSDL